MAGEEEDVSQHDPHGMDYMPNHELNDNGAASPIQTQGRFSRYLRFARRRRNQRDGGAGMEALDYSNEPRNAHDHTDTSTTSGNRDNSM
jgi:hypothetical protein